MTAGFPRTELTLEAGDFIRREFTLQFGPFQESWLIGLSLRYVIDQAISAALAKGLRTADIKSDGTKVVSTSEMGSAILAELEQLAAYNNGC